jgi:hypothetical protein
MEELDRDAQLLLTSQLAILRESLEERNERLREVESEVKYLRNLLNSMTAAPRLAPAPRAAKAPAPAAGGPVPRRWIA